MVEYQKPRKAMSQRADFHRLPFEQRRRMSPFVRGWLMGWIVGILTIIVPALIGLFS